MTAPKFIEIDGKRFVWRDILQRRREQRMAAARIEQPALFELKDDCRPVSERTAAGRYQEPSRHCHGNCIEHALRAKARHESCRGDRISPLCSRFGSEDPQRRSGDEMALNIEGIVNCTVHAEKPLGGSS